MAGAVSELAIEDRSQRRRLLGYWIIGCVLVHRLWAAVHPDDEATGQSGQAGALQPALAARR
jgi:hypothetical protein